MTVVAADTSKYPVAMAYVDSSGNPVLAAGATPLPMGTAGFSAAATFTPAAASHLAGDVNGGAVQFTFSGNTPPASSLIKVQTASLLIAGGTIETTAWTLHLYNVTPPSAIADDAAFDLPSGDRASYLGSLAIAQVVDLGATLFIIAHAQNAIFRIGASSGLFAYLVNGTTLTPQAVAHTVTLHGEILA